MYLCQETYLIISVLIISVVYLITPGARGRQRQIQDTRAICSPQELRPHIQKMTTACPSQLKKEGGPGCATVCVCYKSINPELITGKLVDYQIIKVLYTSSHTKCYLIPGSLHNSSIVPFRERRQAGNTQPH